MKKLITLLAVGAFVTALSSCKTCYECSYDALGVVTYQELCTGDGVSKSELEDAVATLEAFGYECVKQ
ncbi:MAG: hypothetical protein Kow0075_02010 [Salibacteraceae bacterium]